VLDFVKSWLGVVSSRGAYSRNLDKVTFALQMGMGASSCSLAAENVPTAYHAYDSIVIGQVPSKLSAGLASPHGVKGKLIAEREEYFECFLPPLGLSREGLNTWRGDVVAAKDFFGVLFVANLREGVCLLPEGSALRRLFALYGIPYEGFSVPELNSPFRELVDNSLIYRGTTKIGVYDSSLRQFVDKVHPLVSLDVFGEAMRQLKREIAGMGFSSPVWEARFIVSALYSASYDHKLTGGEFAGYFPTAFGYGEDKGRTIINQEEMFALKTMNPSLWDNQEVDSLPVKYARALYGC